MPKYLYLTSHWAHLHITSGGAHRTFILFSIDDRKQIAWYQFFENDAAFDAGVDRDLMTNKNGSYFVLGQPTKSTPFEPIEPRKFNQFAEPGGTRATASVKFVKKRIFFRINVFLKGKFGNEFLDCEFSSKEPAFGVAEREKGVVQLITEEKYSAAALSSPGRIKGALRHGTRTDDPVLITDDAE